MEDDSIGSLSTQPKATVDPSRPSPQKTPLPIVRASDIDDINNGNWEQDTQTEKEEMIESQATKVNKRTHTLSSGPSQKKRKRYTEEQHQLIINAHNDKDRKMLADCIGMPWQTARTLMSRYRKTGKTHDTRQDPVEDRREGKRKIDPCDKSSRGKWGKLNQKAKLHLFHLVHFNCCVSLRSLREQVNRELTREFLLDNIEMASDAGEATTQASQSQSQVFPTKGSALGTRPLLPEEEVAGGPLDESAFFENQKYRDFKSYCLIKSNQTVLNHLDKAGYTRKSVITEKATTNTPSSMEKRLKTACILKHLADGTLEGAERDACLLFLDATPFYLNQHRSRRVRLKPGERAVYRGPPVNNLAFQTHIATVVHPTLGVFGSKPYNPQLTDVKRDGSRKKKKVKSSAFGKKEFEQFIHYTMARILVSFADEQVKADFVNKDIYLLLDGVPEHGGNSNEKIKERFVAKERFESVLKENESTFKIVKLSPNSPHLNLCEYYNRVLKSHVDYERNKLEVRRLLQITEQDQDIEKGIAAEIRVNVMKECVDKALQTLRDQTSEESKKYASGQYSNWMSWLDRVRDARGYLNYYELM